MSDPNLPDDWSWRAFDAHFGDDEPIERDEDDDYDPNEEPPHPMGCVCADCAGAELTADND